MQKATITTARPAMSPLAARLSIDNAILDALTLFRPLLKGVNLEASPAPLFMETSTGGVDYCKLPGPPPRRRRHLEWE